MEHESLLQTIAQVGATFGGLAAVIGAFRRAGNVERTAWLGRDVVEISIIVTILSLLPFVTYGYGLSDSVSWRVCCGVAVVGAMAGFTGSLKRQWNLWRAFPNLLRFTFAAAAITFPWLVLSASGIYFQSPDMTFVCFLLWLLGQAGLMFIIVLTPRGDEKPSVAGA
jgi:hypothetical protein